MFSAFELKPGLYLVKVAFTDHYGAVHPVGETWSYESHSFVPYHGGLTLNIVDASGPRCIYLQDYAETQGEIVNNFSNYVEEIKPPILDASANPTK